MPLDKDAVKNIAFLARIKVADGDLEHMAGELSHIIGWVERLNEVDTDGLEPMASVGEMNLPRRDDVINDGDSVEPVLANAPDPENGFFTVPKVIE